MSNSIKVLCVVVFLSFVVFSERGGSISTVYAAANCSKCKASITENAKFCPECGAKVKKEVNPIIKNRGIQKGRK